LTKRFSFLLLDANIIIELHQLHLWSQFVEICDVHVGKTVVREAAYFEDDHGNRTTIDLARDIKEGRITIFEVDAADISNFVAKFELSYLEKLDPGETEALVKLQTMPMETKLCSADKIVFKVLACMSRDNQGVSLEEVLGSIGQTRKVAWPLCKKFREKYSKDGHLDHIQNRAFKS
jgi:hypothetical protein